MKIGNPAAKKVKSIYYVLLPRSFTNYIYPCRRCKELTKKDRYCSGLYALLMTCCTGNRSSVTFCGKSNQKPRLNGLQIGQAPENPACRLAGITARFREGALIVFLCYCRFSYNTLKRYITSKAADLSSLMISESWQRSQ